MESRAATRLRQHFRDSGWLPISDEVLEEWLKGIVSEVTSPVSRSRVAILPVIQEFQTLIQNNGKMYMGFNQMFDGAKAPYITDWQTLLLVFNKIIQEAPSYGPIGPPIYMVLNQAMNTPGGYTTFLSKRLNIMFKKMFDVWATFLSSSASTYVLTSDPGGWFSPDALTALSQYFDGLTFPQIFKCNPDAPYYGYTSWDDFFNRTFNDGVRTLEFPDNPNIVNGACESKLYNIQKNVKEYDTFWLKGEPYSLRHMLNHDPDYASQFIGGTVFQGFLEVTGYHRWHSPVTGVIKKIVPLEGTYFVESPAVLGEPDNPYLSSLAFITAITTRMLFFIESDNPLIGLMCFIAIGMTEISTCEKTVEEGQRINRGDQLGMFHFGGSSHALVFRPETNITFFDAYDAPGEHVKVRAAIAGVQ